MMDSYILTFFQIHKQQLFRWLTGTWSATERHFCQRVTHVLSKINGKLLSQYLHNQLDLIISIQLISFILFCCKNLLFKTDAICCSARQLHGRSLCWLSLLGLGQVMQDCLESSNLENILNLFFCLSSATNLVGVPAFWLQLSFRWEAFTANIARMRNFGRMHRNRLTLFITY